ncbi:hypothetical protein P8452_33188 [Trifolium repens]|nr:hypothetical protein P8452_33188 [Trifolium repens]
MTLSSTTLQILFLIPDLSEVQLPSLCGNNEYLKKGAPASASTAPASDSTAPASDSAPASSFTSPAAPASSSMAPVSASAPASSSTAPASTYCRASTALPASATTPNFHFCHAEKDDDKSSNEDKVETRQSNTDSNSR